MTDSSRPSGADQEFIQRFNLNFRLQHLVLFVSTTVLIFTGIPLFCLAHPGWIWWDQSYEWIGCIRWIHRGAALGLIAVSVYHVIWTVLSPQGRKDFIALLPMPKDVVDVTKNSLYFLGLSKERPQFGRFSYFEKFDYWAVYWGCVIMIGSGALLWFDRWAAVNVTWLPYTLASEIHADEAILCALALFVWHFYNVHYNPSRFPGSLLWLHGKMSREEMQHEHPLELEKIAQEEQK